MEVVTIPMAVLVEVKMEPMVLKPAEAALAAVSLTDMIVLQEIVREWMNKHPRAALAAKCVACVNQQLRGK